MEDDDGLLANLQTAHVQQARIELDECLNEGAREAADPTGDVKSWPQPTVTAELKKIVLERLARYRRALASLGQTNRAIDDAVLIMQHELEGYIRSKSQLHRQTRAVR